MSWKLFFIKDDDRFRRLVYLMLIFIPMIFLLTFIHETGHLIVALIKGYEILEFKFSLIPFFITLESFIRLSPPSSITATDFIMVATAGSVHTLIWGYIFFIVMYKFKLHPFLEIALFMYSIALVFEMFLYIIFDVFVLQYADWYLTFLINPLVVFSFLSLSLLNLILFLIYFNRIRKKIDID